MRNHVGLMPRKGLCNALIDELKPNKTQHAALEGKKQTHPIFFHFNIYENARQDDISVLYNQLQFWIFDSTNCPFQS